MKPINEHLRAEELFSAYIDKRVTAAEKSFVEQHTAACADCRAKLQITQSTVAATRAMPMVKAPRSFVLPREMARQPRRSVLVWYPALRLATVMAAVAFMIVFAGDLFTSSRVNILNVPLAAPAAVFMAPTAEPETAAQSAAPDQPPQAPAPTAAAKIVANQTLPAGAALGAGTVLSAPPPLPLAPTSTMDAALPFSSEARAAITGSDAMTHAQAPALPYDAITPEPTGVPAAGGAVVSAESPLPAPVDPLRLIELTLGGLVIILGVSTLVARQRLS